MKLQEFRKLIREEVRKIISESSKNKNRKHTFESFLNEEQLNEATIKIGGKIKPSSAKDLATAIITHLNVTGYFYVPHEPTREIVINRLADFIVKSTS